MDIEHKILIIILGTILAYLGLCLEPKDIEDEECKEGFVFEPKNWKFFLITILITVSYAAFNHNWNYFLPSFLLLCTAICVSYTDLKFQLISNRVNWLLFLLSLTVTLIWPHYIYPENFALNQQLNFSAWVLLGQTIVNNACIPVGAFTILCLAMGDFLKRDPIGGGDLKLIASIGILTGTCGGIGAICIGSFIGIIFYVIKRKTLLTKQTPTLAFGPPLLFGAILYLLIKPYFFDFVIQNTDALIQPQ